MRRDFLTIIAITVVVLVCVFIAWPRLGALFQDDESRTLPPPREVASTDDKATQPELVIPLRFRVSDSVTGEAIDFNTLIRLESPDGEYIDEEYGWRNRGVLFDELPGGPVMARVKLRGYLDKLLGPFEFDEATPQVIHVELVPLFEVSIQPQLPAGKKDCVVRVVSEGAPEFPHEAPLMDWQYLRERETFMLPPGRYWLHIPRVIPTFWPLDPDVGAPYTSNKLNSLPGLPTWGAGFLKSFEVVDRELDLKPVVEWPQGEGKVRGRLTNSAGEPRADARVMAIQFGPGPIWQIGGVVRTNQQGEFAISELVAGEYCIQAHYDDSPKASESFVIVRVDGADVVSGIHIVHDGRVHYSESAPDGRARVRILKRGEPVEDAWLVDRGAGFQRRGRIAWVGTRSDENGWAILDDREPQQYHISCHPWTMQSRTLEIRPGETSTYEFDLWPRGTGCVTGSLPDTGPKILEIHFEAEQTTTSWRDYVRILPEDDGTFAVYGIRPGSYEVRFQDENRNTHVRRVSVAPDEMVTLSPTLPTHTIRGSVPPMKGLPRDWELKLVREGNAEPENHPSWKAPDSDSRSEPVEFELKKIPAGKYRLVLSALQSGDVHAVARVDVSSDDFEVADWKVMRAPAIAQGGRLVVRVAPELKPPTSDRIRIYLKGDETDLLLWRSLDLRRIGNSYAAIASFFPEGNWDVRVELDGMEPIKFEYYAEPESQLDVDFQRRTRRRPQSEVEADDAVGGVDRPIGGVKIKLPAPSEPPEHRRNSHDDDETEPAPPPPMSPSRRLGTQKQTGYSEYIVLRNTGDANLWHSVLHFRSAVNAVSVRPLDYTWRNQGMAPGQFSPHVSLCQEGGQLVFFIRGVGEATDSVTLQVPGFELVTIALKDNHGRHDVELVPLD